MSNSRNYQQASDLLTGRCKDRRKLANNTYLERQGNSEVAVILHQTAIVTYRPNGEIVLNSGGWRTPTTKERINQFAPIVLWQKDSIWFLASSFQTEKALFYDGIIINDKGEILSEKKLEQPSDRKKQNALKRKAKQYAKLVADSCPLEQPGPGDCMICQFWPDKGDHLLSHFDEGYAVPSLLARAIGRFNVSPIARQYAWDRSGAKFGNLADIAKQQIEKAVYRYCKEQLGFAA